MADVRACVRSRCWASSGGRVACAEWCVGARASMVALRIQFHANASAIICRAALAALHHAAMICRVAPFGHCCIPKLTLACFAFLVAFFSLRVALEIHLLNVYDAALLVEFVHFASLLSIVMKSVLLRVLCQSIFCACHALVMRVDRIFASTHWCRRRHRPCIAGAELGSSAEKERQKPHPTFILMCLFRLVTITRQEARQALSLFVSYSSSLF